jgi:ElaB/YqjD/DUF883 family membrane-anchored ribosome-binding protein
MRRKSTNRSTPRRTRHWNEDGRAQAIILVVICLLLGFGGGALWFSRPAVQYRPQPPGPQSIALSERTLDTLHKLNSELIIRFYSIFDPKTVPDSLQTFAHNVDQLLSAYQQSADKQVKILRFTAQSNLPFDAAAADGIQVFNLDKGAACYLGVALEYMGRKESLPRLSPDWEEALEPDLTRAIARLEQASQPVQPPVAISQVNTTAVAEVRALIPNVTDVSIEQGKQILHATALKEFSAVAKQMETELKEAQQRLRQVETNGAEADRQAAMKQLQQLQAEQTAKLKEIAARSKAQIDAFQQLKAAAH